MIQQVHSRCLAKRNENICPTVLYVNVYRSFTCSRQEVEAIKMTINWWKDKLCVSTMGYNSEIKRNELLINATTWVDLKWVKWARWRGCGLSKAGNYCHMGISAPGPTVAGSSDFTNRVKSNPCMWILLRVHL